jgi:hypothetical protein
MPLFYPDNLTKRKVLPCLQLPLDFTPHRNNPSIVTTWSTLFILLAFSTTLKAVISVGYKKMRMPFLLRFICL